ncbi:C-C motif chemokine 19-like isoform X2 [Hyperolius riggenbachi]|uniref:C-C motif chemokine 19-like isoform X2 n=1 Tax=Hyperolius riggenbachi TaxID=752182 RepID=UPI0035A281B1
MHSYLLIVIIAFAAVWTVQQASSSRNPSDCCLKTPKAEIPSRAVKCYRRQDLSNCNFPAVVFTTVRGKHLCAPPNEPWVKQLLKLKKKC